MKYSAKQFYTDLKKADRTKLGFLKIASKLPEDFENKRKEIERAVKSFGLILENFLKDGDYVKIGVVSGESTFISDYVKLGKKLRSIMKGSDWKLLNTKTDESEGDVVYYFFNVYGE